MAAYRVEWPAWADWYATDAASITRGQSGSAIVGGGHASFPASTASGKYIEWQVSLAAGTYSFNYLYASSSEAAKMQVAIDGGDVGVLTDGYSAGVVYNNVATITGIALTEGVHTVRVYTNGKNASATDHRIHLQWFSLERTGA